MARQLDHIVVIDVEATCWQGAPPLGQVAEIIEVGVCLLVVATGERLERRSILVRPQRSTLSDFCTRLTTLTQQQVDAGLPFAEACALLKRAFATKDRVWASWGEYDRRQFERQCREEDIPYPFGVSHLNAKTLFALMRKLPHEVGMDEALQMQGAPLEGMHHRADDDAWNIAAILSALLGGA